jgi:hypothetical protein
MIQSDVFIYVIKNILSEEKRKWPGGDGVGQIESKPG